MSKYTNLIDKLIDLAARYRKYANSEMFTESERIYFDDVAEAIENIIEEEAES